MVSTNILVCVHQVMWEHDVKQVSVVERSIRKELGKCRSVRVKTKRQDGLQMDSTRHRQS